MSAEIPSPEGSSFLSRNGRSFSLDYTNLETDTGRLRKFTPFSNLASVLVKQKYRKLLASPEQTKATPEVTTPEEDVELPPQSILSKYRRSFPIIDYRKSMQTPKIDEFEGRKNHRPIPLTRFAPGPAPLWSIAVTSESAKRLPTQAIQDNSPLIVIDEPIFNSELFCNIRDTSSLISLRDIQSGTVSTEYRIVRNEWNTDT